MELEYDNHNHKETSKNKLKYTPPTIDIDPDHVPVAEGLLMRREDNVVIIGVNFRESGKMYYFYPDRMQCEIGDHVIVDTARGMEFGTVTAANTQVAVHSLNLPLRRVLRRATEQDIKHHEENQKKRARAFDVCREKIREHGVEMKLVDVEYAFDGSKLMFYFTADGRVDFRELVKDLAGVFHMRIELRQIGIRDEAKMVGGLGICGRPLCCSSFLHDFAQVSIKMAKEQNLSLNAAKISGTCGRLMCCLRYEYDVYAEESKKLPKVDSLVQTPDGEAIVMETTPLAGLVRVRFTDDRHDSAPRVYHRDDITLLKTKKERRLEEQREKEAMRSASVSTSPKPSGNKRSVMDVETADQTEDRNMHIDQAAVQTAPAPVNQSKQDSVTMPTYAEKRDRSRHRRHNSERGELQQNRQNKNAATNHMRPPRTKSGDNEKWGNARNNRPRTTKGGKDTTTARINSKNGEQRSLKHYGFGDVNKK